METLRYIDLTSAEIEALDREKTVFFAAMSPVETHGTHLPVGTDIFLAEALRDRVIGLLGKKHPEYRAVVLPTMAMGADALPVPGSIPVRHRVIEGLLLDTGGALAARGFRYLVLTDNHGGPHHQIAIEMAARRLARRGFHLIASFNLVFRRMVSRDPELLKATGLPATACGAMDDPHGGTNETSLLLATVPEHVPEGWKGVGPAATPPRKLNYRLLMGASRVLGALGAKDAAVDFDFLAHGLSWLGDPNIVSYQGDPSKATAAAGEAMISYHAGVAMELLEKSFAGERVAIKPLGWSIRRLRNVM